MIRRIFIANLRIGDVALSDESAHHLRDVLRVSAGEEIELFDRAGATARATILGCTPGAVTVRIAEVIAPPARAFSLVVASAVPKGNRGDWLVEKLSELGVSAFIPLAATRSVVLPEGKGKHDRWVRLAAESAQQSRRAGVMRIDGLTPLARAIAEATAVGAAWVLSLGDEAQPMMNALQGESRGMLTLFVGPEGGWTAQEAAAFSAAGCQAVSLTQTVLRIETAAVAGAAVALAARGR